MSIYFKVILVLLFVAYLVSPLDIIPDIFGPIGWIDDTFLLGMLIYYLRTGKLPGFLNFNKNRKPDNSQSGHYNSNSNTRYNSNSGSGSKSNSYSKKEQSNNPSNKTNKKPEKKNPYIVLGIKPGASIKEIHVAYRKAAQKYHPDKVSHLGKDLQELANQKFIEIQEAYNTLK